VALPGDANLDGRVDINDLTIVLANYNQTYSSSVAAAAAVPEPSTLPLLLVGLLLRSVPFSTRNAQSPDDLRLLQDR
jgi:hypothetical protein